MHSSKSGIKYHGKRENDMQKNDSTLGLDGQICIWCEGTQVG